MITNYCSQLFIEGEKNELYIYVHLKKLTEKKAARVLDEYIQSFRKYDFEKINVSFWDVCFPGEHLSLFRKTSDKAIGKILRGFQYIESYYDFKENLKSISPPQKVN